MIKEVLPPMICFFSSFKYSKFLIKSLVFLVFSLFFLASPRAERVLDEQEVMARVLTRNLSVLATSYSPEMAKTLIDQAKSRFDTLISGQAYYNLDQSDQQSIVFGTDNRQLLWQAQATKRFSHGVEGSLSFSNQRDSTNSAFATNPNFYTTVLSLEVRAPLLQNRLGFSDRHSVKVAENQVETTVLEGLTFLGNQAYEAMQTYWNWVAARQSVVLAQAFLTRAQDFYQKNQNKKGLGLSEETDLVAAEALVLQREAELKAAQDLALDWEKLLALLLDLPLEEKLIPKESSFTSLTKINSLEASFKEASLLRTDYLSLQSQAKEKGLQIALAKDSKLPRVDFFTSLKLNSVDPSYGGALGETFQADNPNWLAGINFSLNFENRLAKSALESSKLAKAQLLYQIKALESQMEQQIRLSLQELKLQRGQKDRYGRLVGLQKRKLRLEEEKYFQGRSSSDLIIRYQEEVLNAERLLLNASLQKKMAELQYKHAMGALIPEDKRHLPEVPLN
ncbi:MAG: TolC family protein [Deltaproteobacteria bacterium]|nr:TolC family protein [Deltaproteobacteria bacterium]